MAYLTPLGTSATGGYPPHAPGLAAGADYPAATAMIGAPNSFDRAMVTLAAWLILLLSAGVIVCILAMLGFGDKFLGRPSFFNSLLQKDPRLRSFAAEHARVIGAIALVTFSLAVIASTGLFSRRSWSLWMVRILTLFSLPVFVCYAIAWAACCAGVTGAEFDMGTAGGVACVLILVVLLGSYCFWRREKVKTQFGESGLRMQQAFISGLITLGPADMQAMPTQAPQQYPGQGQSRRPPTRGAPRMFDDQFPITDI